MHVHSQSFILPGIGAEVSHKELMTIASSGDSFSHSYVFSVESFDSLNTLILRLVDVTCPNCSKTEMTDIVFVIDVIAGDMTEQEFQLSLDTITHIVKNMEAFGQADGQQVGLFFSGSNKILPLSNGLNRDQMLSYLQTLRLNDALSCADVNCDVTNGNISQTIQYVAENYFNETVGGRADSRKLLIIANTGRFDKTEEVKRDLFNWSTSTNVSVTNFVLGPGYDVDMEGLLALVTATSHVYVTLEASEMEHLDVLHSQFSYTKCERD